MNNIKRKQCLKVLNSGHSAKNISYQIGLIINQPEEDILRIIESMHWDKKKILSQFNYFHTAKNNILYVDELMRCNKKED